MRYLLFGGNFYYATGGVNDLIKTSENIDELQELINRDQNIDFPDFDWWHIYDSESNGLIRGSRLQGYGASNLEKKYQYDTKCDE